LNNVAKGKRIESPVVFQGGVSKNVGVVKALKDIVKKDIIVDEAGHLMGCIGAAILAKESGKEKEFNFSVKEIDFKTRGIECGGCPNNCEVVRVLRNDEFLDGWGNRCPTGFEKAKKLFGE
jgi:hypothetical protein